MHFYEHRIFGYERHDTALGLGLALIPGNIVADLFGRAAFPSVLRYVSLFLLFELAGFILAR
jgi:hypothetical protein